jgi:uncharacterized membrane protein
MVMKRFLEHLDTVRIEHAIAEAERMTSGEVRVVFQPGRVADPTALAASEFVRLGMTATRERNAVLILIAPDARRFAVYGDEGVHARCGEAFWQAVAAAMEEKFRAGDHTGAVVEGVVRIGQLLAKEFPRREDDRDELTNAVLNNPPVI